MIRSRPFKEYDVRERLMEMRWGLQRRGAPAATPSRVFNMFDGRRLIKGLDTMHRMPEARRWRIVLRMRAQRRRDGVLDGLLDAAGRIDAMAIEAQDTLRKLEAGWSPRPRIEDVDPEVAEVIRQGLAGGADHE